MRIIDTNIIFKGIELRVVGKRLDTLKVDEIHSIFYKDEKGNFANVFNLIKVIDPDLTQIHKLIIDKEGE